MDHTEELDGGGDKLGLADHHGEEIDGGGDKLELAGDHGKELDGEGDKPALGPRRGDELELHETSTRGEELVVRRYHKRVATPDAVGDQHRALGIGGIEC
jgi:hypothetical protein